MMKRVVIACGLALGSAIGTVAQAEVISVTIDAGGTLLSLPSFVAGPLQGEGQFHLSDLFLSAMDIMNARLEGVAPDGRVEVVDEDWRLAAISPVQRVKGVFDTSSGVFAAQHVALGDGFSIVKPGTGTRKVSSPQLPGLLTVSDITVDLDTKAIYANVQGANGVGSMQNLHIWNFETLTGSTNVVISPCPLDGRPCPPTTLEGFQLSGLAITQPAFDVMAQSLALTAFGKASMAGITDYGTLTISPVPESSTLVLMSMGLLGLAICNSIQRRS